MGIRPPSSSLEPTQDLAEGHLLRRLHLDIPLLIGLLVLCAVGLLILYSASNQDLESVKRQALRLGLAFGVMLALAQVPPARLRRWTPSLYGVGILLLIAVLLVGDVGKGAQRWLDLEFMRFQPAEILKLAVPMMVAWLLAARPLPPALLRVLGAVCLILLPVGLIAKQPDLGTAILVAAAGAAGLFIGGLPWRFILAIAALAGALAPVLWHGMHDYQRQRILTFINPESDPLGTGYHIIQSQIAIGSGGLFGKGWLNGTQSHLEFLPERHTDFIFAVIGEELGLAGILALLILYLLIIYRGLAIAVGATDSYGRVLAGGLSLVFFVYVFVNTGMVIGLLPVVGVPLPLVSYGGTSVVTLMAGFGILMAIQADRK